MSGYKKDTINIELLKKFFDNRLNIWLIVSSIIFLLIIYLYFSNFHREVLFPGRNVSQFEFYTDNGNGGNSIILSHNISDSTIDMEFKLKEGFINPYVGISITSKNDSLFDLASYDRLRIDISGEQIRSIGFSLYAGNVYRTDKKEICFSGNVDIDSKRKEYVIDLDKLKVPEWWYGTNNVPVDEKIGPDLQYVYGINIGTAYASAADIKRSLRIYSISFDKDNVTIIKYLVLAELIFILLLAIIHYTKSHKALPVTITYKAVDVEKENRQINSFLDYINNNFHDHNLTLQQVSDHTGINQRRITATIQQTFNCNFKTYVNRLRISESKRLLVESELNIGEISFKVGFSNQTHFNRVFKSFEGISPTEYLENKQS